MVWGAQAASLLVSAASRNEPCRSNRSGLLRFTDGYKDGKISTVTREELLQRIWIDPQRCFGKPCIRGHRIWVSLILDLIASGSTVPQILESYPGLTEADIQACIAYGAEMSRERYVDVRLEPAV